MTTLTIHHSLALIIVSVFLSMASAYVALSLADRARLAVQPLTRHLWLVSGSVAMGIGVWSMHYLGMLAVRLPVPVYYSWPLVAASLGMAIAASFAALKTITGLKRKRAFLFIGSLMMAAGIGAMHYTGMAAMRSQAMEQYSYWFVALSILAAVFFSWLSLSIGLAVQDVGQHRSGMLRIVGACVMGLGIASMHYIAMSGTTFSLCDKPVSMTHTVKVNQLGQAAIAGCTVLILLAALGSASLDRRRFHDLRNAHATLAIAQESLLNANELLSALSNLDGLTGLSNRRHLDEMLRTEWGRAARTGKPLSVLMIDIDSFKALNDLYGHQRGDECLRRVAGALLNPPHRLYDTVARYGGEEFVVLLPETRSVHAVQIAEAICGGIRELQLENLGAIGDVVTVSIGVASHIPRVEDKVAAFVEAADCALYAAKRSGKNRVHLAPSFDTVDILEASDWTGRGMDSHPKAPVEAKDLPEKSIFPQLHPSAGTITNGSTDQHLD